jgi:glutathione S-transferase
MLKFYYATISANSQRVWITLLEKQIPFEPINLSSMRRSLIKHRQGNKARFPADFI